MKPVRISDKNRLTIPKEVFEDLKLSVGDYVYVRWYADQKQLEIVPLEIRPKEEIEVLPVRKVSGTPVTPGELINTLVSYYKSGYISKALIKNLQDASERGLGEFQRLIDKKKKKDVLILEEGDLRRKNISLPNRADVSKQLEDVLIRSSQMDRKTLHEKLEKVFEIIK